MVDGRGLPLVIAVTPGQADGGFRGYHRGGQQPGAVDVEFCQEQQAQATRELEAALVELAEARSELAGRAQTVADTAAPRDRARRAVGTGR